MKTSKQEQPITIHCGKVTDDIETLKALCEKEATKLKTTIQIIDQTSVSVPFWTTEIPELICVGKFYKNEQNAVSYELDFTESTL